MKWLVWILIFGLVGCVSMPEHRPDCKPVPTTAGSVTALVGGILLMPIGLVIPMVVKSAERNRLWAAYPECKDRQGWGNRDLRSCAREIDIKEGRIQEPAPSPPPKQAP